MNNRRQFLKKISLLGLIGGFAPGFIGKTVTKPKFDYGYYPISKIPVFKQVFNNYTMTFNPYGKSTTVTYKFWNDIKGIKTIVIGGDDEKAVYLYEKDEKIKLQPKSFKTTFNEIKGIFEIEYQIA